MITCTRIRGMLTLMLSALAFLTMSISAEAATLTGLVTDQSDNSGLYGATIRVASSVGATSVAMVAAGETGSYSVGNLSAGEYTVTVSYIGYVTQKFTIELSGNDDLIRNIVMVPSLINMRSISVTASRMEEKILEAPASVHVVDADAIASRSALSMTEHIKGLAAVDVSETGLQQSNVVVRGFNNIFSGALLVLTDNRIARVPSLRYNAYHFLPTVNSDIERIEIVSGPGSALYGPNSATGVMHIITKSPFGSQGTTVSVGGGERELFVGSFRHAATYNDRIGFKITGQYMRGLDWLSSDPLEPDSVTLFRPTSTGPDTVGTLMSNARNRDIEKFSAEGRVDFLLNENSSLIVNGGFTQTTDIELTGLGAGQAIDWIYWYGQARYKYKDLFIQTFVNASDAGDTYLLRSGQLIVDKSKLWAGQIQHRYRPAEKLSLTYGFDALFTRPQTNNTINGRNEDSDNIDELGVYLQADYLLTDKFKLVGAARVDNNSELEDPVFSPRGALTFQPNENNNFRFTYNRAYQTPDNNNLFLDLLQSPDPFSVGSSFAPAFGFSPNIDIRVQGVPESGFNWSFDSNGNPRFRSPFAPLDPRGISSSDFIDFNDPIFTNVMWTAGRGAVLSGFADALAADTNNSPAQIAAFMGALSGVAPTTISGVNNTLLTFNPDILGFEPASISDIVNIDRLKPAITETFEIGYKGVINNKLQLSADIYATKKFDFIGALSVETPNVFLDPATLGAFLGGDFAAAYAGASPADQAVLDQLDLAAFGGNGNGSPVDELTTMFTSGAARIPFGTVSPIESNDPTAVLITYRNFGDVTFYGADLAIDFHINRKFSVGGTYSYVTKNFFAKGPNQVHDILLNAPKNKYGLYVRFSDQKTGLNLNSRLRWVDAYPMAGPFVGTSVQAFTVVDLAVDWRFMYNTRFNLSIQNILNNVHNEFVGAPNIGRLVIARLTQTF